MNIMNKILSFFLGEPKPEVPEDGGRAEEEGFKFTDNPFRQNTPDHCIWRDDWLFSRQRYRTQIQSAMDRKKD